MPTIVLTAKQAREVEGYIPGAYDELCAALDEAQGSADLFGATEDIIIKVVPDEE